MPALILGIHCPLCGEGHLLSSLGTKPIIRDVGEPDVEPTLEIVEEQETILDEQGDVAAVSAIHAICCFCSGIFEIDVTVEPVMSGADERGPTLTLVP